VFSIGLANLLTTDTIKTQPAWMAHQKWGIVKSAAGQQQVKSLKGLMLHPIITATEIAMQALAIVRVHCNEGTGTSAIPIIYKTYYKVTLI